MPAMITDAQLLREFATSRDQRAFGELVARHKDMVFSTALRRTGRPDLSADIAQQVFLALATKAAWLSTRASVGGWLYKSTLLETVRRQRDEARRHARERRYAEEEMKLHPPDEASSPDDEEAQRAKDLLPHLDDALSDLPTPDREAIMLRFMRGLSLRDTGAALGTTEEAARKRVSRALEKLSATFQRRGVTATAAVLASTVLPRAIDAAPAHLGTTLAGVGATAPTTGPAGVLFLKAAAMSKVQVVAACALTAAVPLTWQAMEIQDLKEENRVLSAERSVDSPSGIIPPPPRPISLPPSSEPPRVASGEPADPDRRPPRERRGKMDEWRELQRQQQRESRLAALHERLGLDDTQLAVIAEATVRAELDVQALHDAARRTGTPAEATESAAIAERREAAIAAVLESDQWAEYQSFVHEEEAGRREIFANRLLADLQTTLHLSDTQKDEIFAIFAAEPDSGSPKSWRVPIEAMDTEQNEKLADVLNEEQFKLWRQRAEMWSQLFRREPGPSR
ncbi:MAG: RNA polymerase sigma factor [Verrucomicrobiales bacterium]